MSNYLVNFKPEGTRFSFTTLNAVSRFGFE